MKLLKFFYFFFCLCALSIIKVFSNLFICKLIKLCLDSKCLSEKNKNKTGQHFSKLLNTVIFAYISLHIDNNHWVCRTIDDSSMTNQKSIFFNSWTEKNPILFPVLFWSRHKTEEYFQRKLDFFFDSQLHTLTEERMIIIVFCF